MAHTADLVETHVQPAPPVGASRAVAGQIGGYEIRDELGRGGMGVVYRAFDPELKRFVAMKVLTGGADASVDALVRFRGEAEVIARLQHPNIVEIFDSGQHEGHQFLVLELVEGGSLDKQLTGVPQPPREAATTIETIARAVAVAHAEGIVHRDLKPANVLRSPTGTLKITDFGLAKQLDQSLGISRSGDLRGTPQYMAPEQAGRRGTTIGPPTDVYALGAMLYELLTGRPPFVASNLLDMLDQILDHDAASPSRLVPRLPRDLCTICLKCLEKDPARRYPTARELADDLRSWLDGGPIQARPLTRTERSIRFVRRYPLPVAFATTLGLLVGGFTVYTLAAQARYAERLEHHYETAQKALDEISGSILHDPRLSRDKKLLASMADHFQSLLDSQRDLPAANADRIARAHELRGKILAMTGEPQKSAAAYQLALDTWATSPVDTPDRRFDLALAYLELGKQRRELRESAPAAAAYDLAERHLASGPESGSPRFQRLLAEVWHQRGILFDAYQGKSAALAAYNEGLRLRLALGSDPESIRDLARSYGYIGDVQMGLGDLAAAEASYQKSHELRQQTAQAAPSLDTQFQLARSHGNFALMYASAGRWGDAAERLQEARTLQEELLNRESDNPEFVGDYAGTLTRLAETRRHTGRTDEATYLAEQAVALLRPLHVKDPKAAMFRSGLADAALQQASIEIDRDPARAATRLREVRDLLQGHERNEVDRYHHAAALALLAELPGADSQLIPEALAILADAMTKGYCRKSRPVLIEDRPWARLAQSPEFRQIIRN